MELTLTLGKAEIMQTVPCWLCGKPLDLRVTKGGKFYLVCDPDGIQCFIRREQGMERLKKLIKHLARKDYQLEQHTESFFAIQAILREIEDLKQEIEKLEDKAGFLFPDEELLRARDALQKRVNLLLSQLEQVAARKQAEAEEL